MLLSFLIFINAMAPAWAHAEIVLSGGLGAIYFPAAQVDFIPI